MRISPIPFPALTLAAALVAAGCTHASEPVAASLQITVTGPLGAPAAILVTGPAGYSEVVTATTTLSMLTPGTYTIRASDVVTATLKFIATPATQVVDVSASATPAPASVAYLGCPSPSNKVLVDATHDGGTWWYPQAAPFAPGSPHQGEALADYWRSKGYVVDEIGSDAEITSTLLAGYPRIVRAVGYGAYSASALQAYAYVASCPVTILLLADNVQPGQQDPLAAQLGVTFRGSFTGSITTFATDPITAGETSIGYLAGSAVDVTASPSAVPLGWLSTGEPVMGIVQNRPAKIFFFGDVNGIEGVPQPLVDNLIVWGY